MKLVASLLVFTVACTAVAEPTTSESLTPTSSVSTSSSAGLPSTTAPSTSTTLDQPEMVWTEADAEAMVENYLAALAGAAWDVAAFSAFNNGIVITGSEDNELPAETLARLCADGACNGPYELRALGPGLIDPRTVQAASTVEVTHVESGMAGQIDVFTFEGQRVIADLPPLRPSPARESMVEQLFEGDLPDHIVVARNDGFETWSEGQPSWLLNWWAKGAFAVEGDWALISDPITVLQQAVRLDTPTSVIEIDCSGLVERDGRVLALNRCVDGWALLDLETQTPAPLGFRLPASDAEDGYPWVEERGGSRFEAIGDAEGNLVSIRNNAGVDLLGDRYAGFTRIASDGSFLVLVDHRDPATYSHFYSPVVVAVDFETGTEIGRWVLDGPVVCLEADDRWIVACEGAHPGPEPPQVALVAIELPTGEISRVVSRSRLFLPG